MRFAAAVMVRPHVMSCLGRRASAIRPVIRLLRTVLVAARLRRARRAVPGEKPQPDLEVPVHTTPVGEAEPALHLPREDALTVAGGRAPHLPPLTVGTVLCKSPGHLVHTSTRTAASPPGQARCATKIEEPLHQRAGVPVGGAGEGAIEPVKAGTDVPGDH